jgi:hypothetical protein
MLVHVTRFVTVQGHVVQLIKNELISLQRRIEFGDGTRVPTLRRELQDLWETEFVPVSQNLGDEAGVFVSWQQVDSELYAAAAKIETVTVNGLAKQSLEYKDYENDGRSVIAVGGDKLSRGLTLEGLSISYFLRTTRMYDALMQMGRWFGYRSGYLDLCRLFTTGMLKDWYRYIALADEELRREFDYMVAFDLTPEKYGLRVRTHPTGMIVTALNKMSHGETRQLSWAGTLVQTTDLPKETTLIRANLTSTEKLLAALGAPDAGNDRNPKIWRGVKAELVASFIAALKYPALSAGASGEQLATFIRKQHTKIPMELTEWTVVLVSIAKPSDDRKREIAGHPVGLLERNPESQTATTYRLNKSNILSPADESRDFEDRVFDRNWYDLVAWKPELFQDRDWLEEKVGEQAYDVARELTRRWMEDGKLCTPKSGDYNRPNGRVLRVLRPRDRGLLLVYPLLPPEKIKAVIRQGKQEAPTGLAGNGDPIIGVALSFPTSETALGCEYRVNLVWKTEMEDDDRYDDDD